MSKKPIMIPPTIEGIGLGIMEMILREAEKYNVSFESIYDTVEINGYEGTITWDIPVKNSK